MSQTGLNFRKGKNSVSPLNMNEWKLAESKAVKTIPISQSRMADSYMPLIKLGPDSYNPKVLFDNKRLSVHTMADTAATKRSKKPRHKTITSNQSVGRNSSLNQGDVKSLHNISSSQTN